MKKFFCILLLFAFVVVLATVNRNAILNFASREVSLSYYGERVAQIYDLSFIISKTPVGSMNHYMPLYSVKSIDDVNYYTTAFGFFDLEGNLSESEDYYLYQNEGEKLYIYKFGNLITYENDSYERNESINEISDEEAISLSRAFIEDKLLKLNFVETNVVRSENSIIVYFVNQLANIQNYSFMTEVTLTKDGTVIRMNYYDIELERLISTKIISMTDAYYDLPVENVPDAVDLKSCKLVYFFDDSIVQPSYLFEGENSDGELFKCFVKASLYYN